MSGSGNAIVSVTGAALVLRNAYFTVTVSGVIASSSDSIAMSADLVKVSPPTESSAAVSLARAGAPAPRRPAPSRPAAIASAEIPIRDASVAMPELAISDLGSIIAFRDVTLKPGLRAHCRQHTPMAGVRG